MGIDDTFFGGGGGDGEGGDRTVLRPTPGRRARAPATGPPGAGPPPPPGPPPGGGARVDTLSAPGLNPLLDAASGLLSLVAQLRNTHQHNDPAGFYNHVAREIQRFDKRARAAGVDRVYVNAARYALCTFIDQVVLNKPWGGGAWGANTLLSKFHDEVQGGERFFDVLDRLREEPARSLDLIELYYVCLMLGFEGKYSGAEGRQQLAGIQAELEQLIRHQRGDYERELSPRWRGVEELRNRLARYVPLWVVGAAAVAVLLVVFLGLRLALGTKADPVYGDLLALAREAPMNEDRPPVEVATADLVKFLAAERAQGLVEVDDQPGRTRVVLRGLFASLSATVKDQSVPLIGRIATGLNQYPGRVVITGHTDSDPIPASARFRYEDNWVLSTERAEAVRRLLEQAGVSPSRLEVEGLADTEVIDPVNKAQNRRVEIVLETRR